MNAFVRAFLVFLMLAPAAAIAGSTLYIPASVTIKIGATYLSRVSVSSSLKTVALIESDCFSTNSASTDVLYVENPSKRVGSTGSSFTLDWRPRNIGTCTMTFGDGANQGTVHITVTK